MAGPSLGVTAALGMLLTLVYFGIMIWNNDKHMVRASGRDLSYFMLPVSYTHLTLPTILLV